MALSILKMVNAQHGCNYLELFRHQSKPQTSSANSLEGTLESLNFWKTTLLSFVSDHISKQAVDGPKDEQGRNWSSIFCMWDFNLF